jgi:hypothetical protein
MTSQYGPLIEKIVNNEQTNFMRLNDVHMEQKKYVSTLNFGEADTPLTLQLPQCSTKAGIVEQSAKTYADLLFDSSANDVKELVDLLIAMEEEAAKQLHGRSGEWFEGDSGRMTVQSFEDMFTPVVRYVNRQKNVCVRVHIPTSSRGIKQASTGYDCDIYDRASRTRLLSDIRADTHVLPLVEVKEIRMSSTSISLHLNLVECMIVKDSETVNGDTEQRAPARRLQLADAPAAAALTSDVPNESHAGEPAVAGEEEEKTKGGERQESQREVDDETVTENVAEVTDDPNVFDKADSATEVTSCDESGAIEVDVGVESNKDGNEGEGEDEGKSKDEDDVADSENIDLPIETVEIGELEVESDVLEEIGALDVDEAEPIKLKKPDEVYKDIYKAAITKAKKLRQVALEAYLDAKKIKAKFMLEDIYDSDEDGDEDEDDAELEEVTNLSVQ